MKIIHFCLGKMQTNCYLIENQDHSILIDPGADGQIIEQYLQNHSLKISYILLTHGHFDHIGAVDYLCERYDAKVYIHPLDMEMLYNDEINLSHFEVPFILKTKVLPAQEEMELEGFQIKWILLPGHTPGSSFICFENEQVIFSGDVLFKGSIGRFDFPRSSIQDMRKSLDFIKGMSGFYRILPGHGDVTTLQEEQQTNMNLR